MRQGHALGMSVLVLCVPVTAFGWGLRTHRWVNENAVRTLPEPLRSYFAENRERLSDLAVEPDVRLRAVHGEAEAVRHYIDLDLYGEPPFRELPRSKREALRKYGERTVDKRGLLPWTLLESHARLVGQMRDGNWRAALRTAGLAGHYVADAFMPLHTTDNHDGQKSGNHGIHHAIERDLIDGRFDRWKGRLSETIPEARSETFDPDRVFAILVESYHRVPALLDADRRARRAGKPGTSAYLDALEREAGALLVSRIVAATGALGSFWLSAWVAAAKPQPPLEGTLSP